MFKVFFPSRETALLEIYIENNGRTFLLGWPDQERLEEILRERADAFWGKGTPCAFFLGKNVGTSELPRFGRYSIAVRFRSRPMHPGPDADISEACLIFLQDTIDLTQPLPQLLQEFIEQAEVTWEAVARDLPID